MRRPFIILLLFCAMHGKAQLTAQEQQHIDSLEKVIKTAKHDSTIVRAWTAWGNIIYFTNPDLDLELSQKIIDLSSKNLLKKLGKKEKLFFQTAKANALNNHGNASFMHGDYTKALRIHFEVLKLRKETGNTKGLAATYNNIGIVYFNQGNLPAALEKFYAALKLHENARNKRGLADTYNYLGIVYDNQGDYDEALKKYQQALKLQREIGDTIGITISSNNIGIVYKNRGKYTEALKEFLSVLTIMQKIGDKDGIAKCFNNLGNVYERLGKTGEALEKYHAALVLEEEIGDKSGASSTYNNIGSILLRQHQIQKARAYILKGLEIAKETGHKEYLQNAYNALAAADSAQGNYKSSYLHYKMYILYRDSLYSEDNEKKSLQVAMTYEFERKQTRAKVEQDKKDAINKTQQEKKDEINRAEKKRQLLIIILVSCVLVVVIVFAIFIARNLRTTRKQKLIIEEQKTIVEEKHKEITDSINYAERIQRSFLATHEILESNLKASEHFVLFKPKDVVSGDFYWAANLADGSFIYVTADSTGHGVPGAIMSILNISSLENAIEKHNQPHEILNQTRKTIIDRLKNDGSPEGGKDGMDGSLILLDKNRKQLRYAASNNPVWIVRNHQLLEFAFDKFPVGRHDKDQISFTNHTVDLQAGDIIYTFTDGMPDQFGGPKGKKFKYTRLKEVLLRISTLPMKQQHAELDRELREWMGSLEQVDDVCVMGVRIP